MPRLPRLTRRAKASQPTITCPRCAATLTDVKASGTYCTCGYRVMPVFLARSEAK